MLLEIEDAILARLSSLGDRLAIRNTPDGEHLRRSKPKGALAVGYRASRYTTLTQSDVASVSAIAEFEVLLMLEDLQTHRDALPLLDLIRLLLLGFQPQCSIGGMVPLSETFVGLSQSTWAYRQVWAVNVSLVQPVSVTNVPDLDLELEHNPYYPEPGSDPYYPEVPSTNPSVPSPGINDTPVEIGPVMNLSRVDIGLHRSKVDHLPLDNSQSYLDTVFHLEVTDE